MRRPAGVIHEIEVMFGSYIFAKRLRRKYRFFMSYFIHPVLSLWNPPVLSCLFVKLLSTDMSPRESYVFVLCLFLWACPMLASCCTHCTKSFSIAFCLFPHDQRRVWGFCFSHELGFLSRVESSWLVAECYVLYREAVVDAFFLMDATPMRHIVFPHFWNRVVFFADFYKSAWLVKHARRFRALTASKRSLTWLRSPWHIGCDVVTTISMCTPKSHQVMSIKWCNIILHSIHIVLRWFRLWLSGLGRIVILRREHLQWSDELSKIHNMMIFIHLERHNQSQRTHNLKREYSLAAGAA